MDSVLRSTSGNIAASRSSFTALSAICSADLQQAPAAALRPAASRSAPDGAEQGSLANVDQGRGVGSDFVKRPHPNQTAGAGSNAQ